MAICWAAGKGLDLQRLATSRPSSYPGEKRASEVSFIEVAEKKNSRTFRKSKKGLKKTKCPAVRTFSRISTKSLVLIILKAFYRHLQLPSRPVTRLFYGDVQSNAEIDQMRPEGQVPGGGAVVV